MKTRKTILTTALVISVAVATLLLSLSASQREIHSRANSLVDENVRFLDSVHHLHLAISRELLAANQLIQNDDIEVFSQRHAALHMELLSSLQMLETFQTDTAPFEQIEQGINHYHHAIETLIASIAGRDNQKDTTKTLNAYRDLQQKTSNLAAYIDAFRNIIIAEINLTKEDINQASRSLVVKTYLMALGLIGALILVFFYLQLLDKTRQKETALSFFPERAPEAMLTIDANGDIIYANPRSKKILFDLGFQEDDLKQLLPSPIKTTIKDLQSSGLENAIWNHRVGAAVFRTTLQWLHDLNQGHVYFHDISRTEDLQKRLNYLAYFDPLTSLPNRRRFEEEIDNILSLNKYGTAKPWAIGLIRLDRFAHVTTGHGYNIGDKLLAACAKRLNDVIQDYHDAHLFRFDGARFGILVLSSQGFEIVDALNKAMQNPVTVDDISFYLTLSIGYTITPGEDDTVSKLIINAGAALESATEKGGNALSEFNQEMRSNELKWLNLEIALRQSLFAGELDVYYQPQVSSVDGSLAGMEALVRWRKDNGEFISPSEFIPLAERIGLIVVLGEWILHRAFRQAALWHKDYGNRIKVAVNISIKQFNHVHFIDMLKSAVESTGVDPHCIDIEITESVMQENIDHAMDIIKEMKKMGFSISIDDFGTGYSSMSYLKYLPVDKIKIDRVFITGISNEDSEDQNSNKAIATSIIELGHNLNMAVVAEGVDNSEQVDFLRSAGCDFFQGFLFSEALNADDMAVYIDNEVSQALTSSN